MLDCTKPADIYGVHMSFTIPYFYSILDRLSLWKNWSEFVKSNEGTGTH